MPSVASAIYMEQETDSLSSVGFGQTASTRRVFQAEGLGHPGRSNDTRGALNAVRSVFQMSETERFPMLVREDERSNLVRPVTAPFIAFASREPD